MINSQSCQQFIPKQVKNTLLQAKSSLYALFEEKPLPQDIQIQVPIMTLNGKNALKKTIQRISKDIHKMDVNISIEDKLKVINQYEGQFPLLNIYKANQERKMQSLDSYYLLAKHNIPSHKLIDQRLEQSMKNAQHQYNIFWKSYQISKMKDQKIHPNQNTLIKKKRQKALNVTQQMLIKLAVYSPIQGNKERQFLIPICYPINSFIKSLYCLISELSQNKNENEQEFLYLSGVKYYQRNRQKRIKMQDLIYQQNRYLDEPWQSVKIQLGKPGIYRHLGGCDHMVVVTQIRMMNQYDEQNLNQYPINQFLPKMKRRRCESCSFYYAKVITINDLVTDKGSCYLCQKCSKQIHEDNEGNSIYSNYEMCRYIHD